MPTNTKKIIADCDEMSAGLELVPDVEFNGYKKADFDTEREALRLLDIEIEEDTAALKAKKARYDDMVRNLATTRVKIGKGIAGHKDYGDDSVLYGAVGFIRKSDRKSGLIRGKKTNGDGSK